MFDVGFTELVMIGLVALLVLGPTKMMEVARFAGRWAGRLRRQFNEVKDDIDRELKLEEMRRKLAEEERALRANLDVPVPSIDPMRELREAVSSAPAEAQSPAASAAAVQPNPATSSDDVVTKDASSQKDATT